jgi:hypothetical protein
LNGTVASGDNYVKLIQKEFKIQDFESFMNQIRETLIEATQYYIENKNWDISSLNYGKPLSTAIPIELSVEKIKETISSILIKIIDKFLPQRNIQEENILTKDEQETLDKTTEILKTIQSGNKYQSNVLDNRQSIVRGCMNPNALNYNPLAKEDDGSCIFTAPTPAEDKPIQQITENPKTTIVSPPVVTPPPTIKYDAGGYPYYDVPATPAVSTPPIVVNTPASNSGGAQDPYTPSYSGNSSNNANYR